MVVLWRSTLKTVGWPLSSWSDKKPEAETSRNCSYNGQDDLTGPRDADVQ